MHMVSLNMYTVYSLYVNMNHYHRAPHVPAIVYWEIFNKKKKEGESEKRWRGEKNNETHNHLYSKYLHKKRICNKIR